MRAPTTKAMGIIKRRAPQNGTPRRLFHAASPAIGVAFDVSSDGKRLLVNHSEEEAQAPLQLVTNWLVELKK